MLFLLHNGDHQMIKKTLVAGTALAAALTSGLVAAETTTTANFAVSSDYIFRGVNYGAPAVSGGLDTAYDSGLYTGVWLSNTNGANAGGGSEVDLYVGYAAGAFDVGYIGYFFPGDAPTEDGGVHGNLNEIYASTGLGESWSGMVSYGFGANGVDDDEYAYVEVNGTAVSMDVHLGVFLGLGDGYDGSCTALDEAACNDGAVDVALSKSYGDFTGGVSMRFDDSTLDERNEDRPNFFVSWGTEFDVAAK
jgi:uncharacterized protein (TIGR02001 family)